MFVHVLAGVVLNGGLDEGGDQPDRSAEQGMAGYAGRIAHFIIDQRTVESRDDRNVLEWIDDIQ